MQMRHNWQISKRNAKGGQQSFNMMVAWKPVCYHGNKTGMLILWAYLIDFWYKLAEILFSSQLIKIELSLWWYHLANLHALKLQYEVFVNSKQSSSHTDHLFIF